MIFIYLVSLLAGTLWGITESINKNITEKKYSAFSYFLLQIGLNLILYTGPFILYGSFVKEPIAYFYLFTPTLFIFLGNLFLIKAYKTEDISNINILSRSSLIIAFLSGIFFLHEKITFLNILGLLAILGFWLFNYLKSPEGEELYDRSKLRMPFLKIRCAIIPRFGSFCDSITKPFAGLSGS